MKTLTDATLYIVEGPRGPYYAIRENDTGAVLTERTERAAMGLANQRDLVVVDRLKITHALLLAMTADIGSGEQPQSITISNQAP